ncbi:hypothetical protein ACFQZQ_00360 [Lysobacter koreensis]|uniref:Uncharacterized protein n=1 Tax=Lysobacter koreensis TaxID=266122 RepID=A0ABW2YID8_9GAMM
MNVRRNPAAGMLAMLLALPVLPAGSRDVAADGARIDCQQRHFGHGDTAWRCTSHGGDLVLAAQSPLRERRIPTMAVR